MESTSKSRIHSHCSWDLEKNTDKTSDALLEQLDIHLRDNPKVFTIPAALFKAYIYAFYRKSGDEDPEANKAICLLEQTHREIDQFADNNCTCGSKCSNSCEKSAQGAVGFRIVCDTLLAKIYEEKMEKAPEAQKYYRKVNKSLRDTTDQNVAKAYIHGTRAFSLSRLGPNKMNESLEYFQKACEYSDRNTDWLYGKALINRRITKQHTSVFGIPRKETDRTTCEKELYDEILKIDPGHTLAKLFKALVLFNENNTKAATDSLEELLEDASSHSNLEVLDRSIAFFREIGHFARAQDLIQEAEKIKGAKDAFLYHQKALISIERYNQNKKNSTTDKSDTELLQEALQALKKAKEARDSPDFVKDRVWVHLELGEIDEAEEELERISKRLPRLWNTDKIRINVLFGNLFIQKHCKKSRADEISSELMTGLEKLQDALRTCCKDENVRALMKEHMSNIANLNDGLLKQVYDAISQYENYNSQLIQHHQNEGPALQNMGWLKLNLSCFPYNFQDNATAREFYERAFLTTHSHGSQDVTVEILEGFLDSTISDPLCFEQIEDLFVVERSFDELHKVSPDGRKVRIRNDEGRKNNINIA